jgi:hypothetical protein
VETRDAFGQSHAQRYVSAGEYLGFHHLLERQRGFAFARRDDGNADVFVHVDQIVEDVSKG